MHNAAGILQTERGEILPVRAHGGAHEIARAGIPDIDGLAGGVIHRDGALIARSVRADSEIAAVAQVGADDLAGGLDIGLAALEIRHAQRRAADVIGAHALAADRDARLREREDLVQDGLAVIIEQLQTARGHDREAAVHRAEGAAGAGVKRVGRAVIQIVARRAGPVAQQQIQKQQHGQHAHRHDDGLPQPGISFLVVVHGHSSPIRRADAVSGLIHHIADGAVVPHAVEIQPLRGHGRPRKTPVARGQQRRDGLRLDLAVGRIDHGADNGAHHIIQEAVSTDGDGDERAVPLGAAPVHRAHGRARLGTNGAHGGKVVRALKGAAGAREPLKIQRLGIKADAVLQKRIADAGVIDLIDIFFLDARADGIEVLRRGDGVDHGDVRREAGIDRKGNPVDRDRAVGAEIGTVALCVHARVRAAAADDLDRFSADLRERALQRFGDGDVRLLHLPAVIGRAVILQAQGDVAPHRPNLASTITPASTSALQTMASVSRVHQVSCFMRVRPSSP